MFGLIRILLLLVIIAAVALLIRPDLIEMAGLAGPKPPHGKEKTVSAPAPVAEQQVSESATTTDADSPKPAEQTVENATPKETITPQQNDTVAESDAPQEEAPGHDPEILNRKTIRFCFTVSGKPEIVLGEEEVFKNSLKHIIGEKFLELMTVTYKWAG